MKHPLENIRIHVFEPEDSPAPQDPWYKEPSTFSHCGCFDNPEQIQSGHILEDDMGTRFRVTSVHWKWKKEDLNVFIPVLEFTVERYMRHGKQNPFML